MKNALDTLRAGGFVLLLLLSFSISFRALAIKPVTPRPVMCEGVSVPIADFNGGLYTLEDGDEIRSIKSVATGRVYDFTDPGADFTGRDSIVTPTSGDCEYEITYYNSNSGDTKSITVSIDAKARPKISASLNSASEIEISGLGGVVCPGTRVLYDYYVENAPDIFINAPGEFVIYPDFVAVLPEHSGIVSFLAGNGYCPVSEVSIPITVESPTLDNIELDWTTSFGGGQPVCATCGFFPQLSELVAKKLPNDSVLDNASTVVEWADAPAEDKKKEIVLTPGVTVKRVHLKFQVQRKSAHCGAGAPREIDTVIDLRITAKDCRPVIPTRFSIQPCQSKELNVMNPYYPTVNIESGEQAPQMLNLNPSSLWKITPASDFVTAGSNQYLQFKVELVNYDGPSSNTQFRIQGSAKLSCPYSKLTPIQLKYDTTFRTTVDTDFVSVDYRFCPGGKADLKISLPENGEIATLTFSSPAGAENLFERRMEDEAGKKNLRCYRTKDDIADPESYTPLELMIAYSLENCAFSTDHHIEEAKLATRDDCLMVFDVTETGCAGEDFKAELDGKDVDIVVDSIVIDSTGGFAIGIGNFTASGKTGRLIFNPYYNLSSGEPSQTGEISLTAYYRPAGSGGQTSLSVKKMITVKSCPPSISSHSFSFNSDVCMACPGTKGTYAITFYHPTTNKDKCSVNMVSNPFTPVVAGWWRELKYYVDCYFYESTQVAMDVIYNQGDSMCVARLESGSYNFNMDEKCKMYWKVDYNRDSCCEGDLIDAVVVNANTSSTEVNFMVEYYETFQHLVWDEAVLPYVDASCKVSTPYGLGISGGEDSVDVTVSGTKIKCGKGFKVKVRASADGIYPFTVYSKVRDSVVQRRDTLRLYTIPKPHIFIRDTIFVCTGDEIEADIYVDSSVVESVTPNGWAIHIPTVIRMGGKVFYASAEMRYVCGDGAGSGRIDKDSLVAVSDSKVYLALGFNPDKDGFCAEQDISLTVPTNGRVTWFRQVSKGNSLSNIEKVGEDMRFNEPLEQILGADTLLYTVEVRTSCPGDSLRSGSFYVRPKPLPFVDIIEEGFCGGSIYLKADTITEELDDPLQWYNKADGSVITASTVSNGTGVVCKVNGKNGCQNADTATMVSTPIPDVRITGDFKSDKILCVSMDDTLRLDAVDHSSNTSDDLRFHWWLNNRTDRTDTIGNEAHLTYAYGYRSDTVIYFRAGSGSVCDYFDTLYVRMNPEPRPVADTMVCLGSSFSFAMPEQTGVVYQWLDGDGQPLTNCDCPIRFSDFDGEDARRGYKVRLTRGYCTITQDIRFDTFADPHLTVTGPYGICEGGTATFNIELDLSVNMGGTPKYKWITPKGETPFIPYGVEMNVDDVTPADSGVYCVQAMVNGCLYADSIRFRVSPRVRARIASAVKSFYCEGDSLRVTAADAGDGVFYAWRGPNPSRTYPTDTVLYIASLTRADSGNIFLTVRNEFCSDSTTGKRIDVRAIPSVSLVSDGYRDGQGRYVFCMGDDVVLTIPDAAPGDDITWVLPSDNVLTHAQAVWGPEEASDEIAGVYAAVLGRGGCVSDTAFLEVAVNPLPVLYFNDTSFCASDGNILLDIDPNDTYPDAEYSWSVAGANGSTVLIADTGIYTVGIVLMGCSSEVTFHVSLRYAPVWEFDLEEDEICVGDSVILTGPEDADEYLWETPEGTSVERVFVARRDGYYELTASKSGCADDRGFTLTTDYCTSPLFFAEVFNPKSSVEANRCFGAITSVGPEELDYEMYIFDLNGQLVFKSSDITEMWNGTVRNGGAECPMGIYYYRCSAFVRKSGRDISTSGMVRLLR